MNELQVPDLGLDWGPLYEKFQSTGIDLGLKLIAALAIFFIGRALTRFMSEALRSLMQSRNVDKILETFVSNLAYWALMAFVIIAAINQVGVQTTSLIAIMGAAGLAVGLALQGSLSNFAAGVLIVVFRPYKVGDFVEAAGISGTIAQVQILTTIMTTGDNKQIVVPNSKIMNSIITNYSANDTRRIELVVGVGYDDDLDKVRRVIREIVETDKRILKEPECLIAVSELADSSVNFLVRPWVKTADYWSVKFDLTETIKKRFDKEDISLPFPQQDVHLFQAT